MGGVERFPCVEENGVSVPRLARRGKWLRLRCGCYGVSATSSVGATISQTTSLCSITVKRVAVLTVSRPHTADTGPGQARPPALPARPQAIVDHHDPFLWRVGYPQPPSASNNRRQSIGGSRRWRSKIGSRRRGGAPPDGPMGARPAGLARDAQPQVVPGAVVKIGSNPQGMARSLQNGLLSGRRGRRD